MKIPFGKMLMCLTVKEGLIPHPNIPGRYITTTQYAQSVCALVIQQLVEKQQPVIFFLPEDWKLEILNEEGHNLLEEMKEEKGEEKERPSDTQSVQSASEIVSPPESSDGI